MIGDSIGAARGAKLQLREAKRQQQQAKEDRERALGIAESQDWTPAYVADSAPTFQKSQSPVAQSFLESLLTGSNPAAVQGTRAGAPAQRAVAQQSFNQTYGTTPQLVAQQRQLEQATPWKTKAPVALNALPDSSDKAMRAKQLGYLTQDELTALESAGFGFKDGRFREKYSNTKARDFMHGLGLDTDTRGGEGQQLLTGLARALMRGDKLEEYYYPGAQRELARAARQGA